MGILKAGTAANSNEKNSSVLRQETESGTEQHQQQTVGHNVAEEAASEGGHPPPCQTVSVDGPPTKRQKTISESERQKYEALAACFADAQIEYKADGKTASSHANSYQRYAAYAKATTFSEALSLGATGPDIFYDFKLGLLSIIDKGNPSAECDSRFHRLSNAWKCRAQGQAPAKFSDPKAILKQTL